MKTLNTLKYLLIAIIILGLFANMAQNDYSLYIIKYFYFVFALVFLAEWLVYFRLLWKQKKSSAIFVSAAFACLFLFLTVISPIDAIDVYRDTIAIIILLIFAAIIMAETVIVY